MIAYIESKFSTVLDAIALNSLTLLSILTMTISKETVTWVIGCLVGVTVAWFNVEKALKVRKERKYFEDKEKFYKDED
jgi:hypothetical protein